MGEKLTVQKHVDLETIPADSILICKVDGAPKIEDVQSDRGTWQKVNFRFKILGFQVLGDGSHPSTWEEMVGKNLFGSVSAYLSDSPDNKLRQWVSAILGMEIGLGFELDLDFLEGRQVRVVTSTYTKKDKTVRHQAGALLPIGEHRPVFYGDQQGQAAQTPVQSDPWAVGPSATPQFAAPMVAPDPWNPPQQAQHQPVTQPAGQSAIDGGDDWSDVPF